jgi:hypothetical protein
MRKTGSLNFIPLGAVLLSSCFAAVSSSSAAPAPTTKKTDFSRLEKIIQEEGQIVSVITRHQGNTVFDYRGDTGNRERIYDFYYAPRV